ncbi:hypothetical protein ANCDUO_12370 [Ancylostoma duodenale]|uniref:Uncharacterized protein n=1 Tax=Ancylostoma duodenale TaxID=51022 RepID=A0A0C2GEX8_9BILA|nr:hypothetical protein ANCDUO_12370 [Ancylostoma duodenale]
MLGTLLPDTSSVESSYNKETKRNDVTGGSSSTTEIILERKHKYSIEPDDISTKGANQTNTIAADSSNEEKTNAATFGGMGTTNAKMFQTAEKSQENTMPQNTTESALQNSEEFSGDSTIGPGTTPESRDTILLPDVLEIDNQLLKKNSTDSTLDDPSALETEETTLPPGNSTSVVKKDHDGRKTVMVATGTTRASQSTRTDEHSMKSSTTLDIEEILGKSKANKTRNPLDDLLGEQSETTALATKSFEGKSSTGARKVARGKVHELDDDDTSTEKYSSDSGSPTQQTTTTPDKDDLDVIMSRNHHYKETDSSVATDGATVEKASTEKGTSATHGPEDDPSKSSQQTFITKQTSEDDVAEKSTGTPPDSSLTPAGVLNTSPHPEDVSPPESPEGSPATETTAEDDSTRKVPPLIADRSSTMDDAVNATITELSSSEDTEETPRRFTAPTPGSRPN